ncbi:hypothetical protein [Demequina litorisediminis]
MSAVTVRAPGKVNLQLDVGPLGVDGYHPLATVFQAVELYEVVTATPRDDNALRVTVEAPRGLGIDVDAVPTGPENLVVRAAVALRDAYGVDAGADLHIVKGVPVAGGMAGGSADAAAAILACAEAWEMGLSRAEARRGRGLHRRRCALCTARTHRGGPGARRRPVSRDDPW